MHRLTKALCLLVTLPLADAILHDNKVTTGGFDSSQICWWSLVPPPDPICPVLRDEQQVLRQHHDAWEGGDQCEGVYCLYSNRGFAGGRGITLITTKNNYARVKAIGDDVFMDVNKDDIPYQIGDDGTIVASRPLKRGDLIMAYTPILLVHRSYLKQHKDDANDDAQSSSLLEAAIAALPGSSPLVQQQQLTFPIDLGDDDGAHYGAIPELARFTHDCRPNTVWTTTKTKTDHQKLLVLVSAVRSVAPGAPLTTISSHNDDDNNGGHAPPALCETCRASAASSGALADSETRVREIGWIEDKLADAAEAEGVTTGLVGYLLGLYENERLHCCVGGAYALAARTMNMLGYPTQAVTYAELAVEALRMEKGEGSSEGRDMEALRRNPITHGSFEVRVRKKGKGKR